VTALVLATAWAARAGDAELVVRVFAVHHRPVAEATQAIEPLLSAEGTVTVKPRAGEIIVQDHRDVVERVAEFLKRWDAPPPPQRLQLTLLLATNAPPKRGQRRARLDPELERRVASVFHYRFFGRLGASTVEAAAGDEVVVALGDRYRVRLAVRFPGPRTMGFHPGRAPARPERFRLEPLVLERREAGEGGERLVPVLRTTVGLAPGQRVVVGAAPSEDADAALVLVVESLAGEGR